MARPKKLSHDKKSEVITIHCTKSEKERIEKKANDYSASEFCLNAALGVEIIPKDTNIPKLLFELNKVGVNLNQIAYKLNSGKKNQMEDVDGKTITDALDIITEIKNEIL